jgi:hypothetical protein
MMAIILFTFCRLLFAARYPGKTFKSKSGSAASEHKSKPQAIQAV